MKKKPGEVTGEVYLLGPALVSNLEHLGCHTWPCQLKRRPRRTRAVLSRHLVIPSWRTEPKQTLENSREQHKLHPPQVSSKQACLLCLASSRLLLRTFWFLFWYLIHSAFGSFHSTPSIILPDVIVSPLVPQPGPEAHRPLALNATRLAVAHAFLGLMVTANKATASPLARGWLMLLSRVSV